MPWSYRLSLGLSCKITLFCEIVRSMKRRFVAVVGLVALTIALLMLQLTTPKSAGLFGVLIFFGLIYVTVACLFYISLRSLFGLLERMLPPSKWRHRAESLTAVKTYYYASVLALAPVILIGMRSVGDVAATDVLLLVLFELLACFYISRRF